jgi:5-methylcytosine-specific restriction endonuclease McrA
MAFRHPETLHHQLHQSLFLRPPEGRLWVLKAIWIPKISIPRIRTNRFFQCPVCIKCVRKAFRHYEISLHRNHQRPILRLSEDRLWVLWVIRLLKTSLNWVHPNCFFLCSGCRKLVRMSFRYLETSLRFHQSRFLRRPDGRSWVLRAIRLLKTSLKRLHPSCFFRCPGCRKWVLMAFRHLETSHHRLL